MDMLARCCFALIVVATVADAARYPSNMKACYRDDPGFNACALKSAQEIMPDFTKGDRKQRMPSLDPMEVVKIEIKDRNLVMKILESEFTGLRDADIKDVKFDFQKKQFHSELVLPHVNLIGKYDMSGRLLVLPIKGNGALNITLDTTEMTLDTPFRIEQGHIMFYDPVIKMNPKRGYMTLANLFNGNELLGREMNDFIDKNWRDVYNEISPPILEGLTGYALAGINARMKTDPFEMLFPKTPT